jgi:hypothetical protein
MKAPLTLTAFDAITNAQNCVKLALHSLRVGKVFVEDYAAIFMALRAPY